MIDKNSNNKIVIGIDPSYTDTGIAVVLNGKLRSAESLKFDDCTANAEKRNKLTLHLNELLNRIYDAEQKYSVIVIMESIGTFNRGVISPQYLKMTGALQATITDTCYHYGINVYSVDRRAWKAQVIGTSKPALSSDYDLPLEKVPTIDWCIKQGYKGSLLEPMSKRKKKGIVWTNDDVNYTYNDNIADAIAIAHYGFIDSKKQKLHKEE